MEREGLLTGTLRMAVAAQPCQSPFTPYRRTIWDAQRMKPIRAAGRGDDDDDDDDDDVEEE